MKNGEEANRHWLQSRYPGLDMGEVITGIRFRTDDESPRVNACDSATQFVRTANGAVWPVRKGRCEGKVRVSEARSDLERLLDAISDAVTGSDVGLEDIGIKDCGGGVFEFRGCLSASAFDDERTRILMANDPELTSLLSGWLGVDEPTAQHAISSIDNQYGQEAALAIAGTLNEIRTPAFPEQASYVRILRAGYEVAYWVSDEWQEEPQEVMGAILGAAGRT